MTDEQLRSWHSKFQVGDEVRHCGTKQWGKVIEVKPTYYGVELIVERIPDDHHSHTGHGYWEGSRVIDQHRTPDGVLRWY